MTPEENKARAMAAFRTHRGQWAMHGLLPMETQEDLSIAYTPGMGAPCMEIAANPALAYDMTMKGRTVAVVSDGSAVLGLGNIGPEAGLPVMEGKAVMYKKYAGIDAVPIVLACHSVDEIVATVTAIAPTFGGIHLEDIAAPQCFEIERRLIQDLSIPVMHDDQHATAVVLLAAMLNAIKVVQRELSSLKIVVNGAGAAGLAVTQLLLDAGVQDVTLVDSRGIISPSRTDVNGEKQRFLAVTNPRHLEGGLVEAMKGADVFIGLSKAGLVSRGMVESMAKDPIIIAMANPVPEIMPDEARAAGAAVVATGRADFPNQVNNVLVYPGLFRGLLERRASTLTVEMKLAAARALAALVPNPTPEEILPAISTTNPADAISEAIRVV